MHMKFKVMGSFCAMELFEVNGISAREEDFGEKGDEGFGDAEDYACGNMKFRRKEPSPEVLAKYHITESEYSEIAGKLEERLSFGLCNWCV